MTLDPGGPEDRPLAIVTGAASGIGHALGDALLQRGQPLVALDLHVDTVNPLAALEGLHDRARGSGVSVHALCPGLVRTPILEQTRHPEALASRALSELDAGAPFYGLRHEDTRAWIAGRRRAIEHGAAPFSGFASPPAAVASAP